MLIKCLQQGIKNSEFCLKQDRKISDICLKQGQGMRGRAAPPHPGIYRVPPGNYHMSIKKSQAILKHFVDLKFSVWFTLCPENETMFCDRTFSRSTADQDCQNTKWLAVYPASRVALIALRSFLDKSGKGKKEEERGKRKEERGKRKEERGKRKEERGRGSWKKF